MKKKYSSKLAWMGAALCAILLVACGLKITEVTLSANEIEQGDEITVTARFEQHKELQENNDIYLLYALRVPSDWTVEKSLEAISTIYTGKGEEDAIVDSLKFKESKAYTALANYCFPESGYKWIGFQTVNQHTLTCNEGDFVESTITLRAGDTTGEFKLQMISGAVQGNPADLLLEDGSLNIEKAFGLKRDLSQVGDKKLDNTVWGLSCYLVCSTTFTSKELEAYADLHIDQEVKHNEDELPICATADIPGQPEDTENEALKLTVTVKEKFTEPEPEVMPEIADLIIAEGAAIDGNFINCEDNLTITFNVPEGYDLYYRLSTESDGVRRKAHGEEGEHDGFNKYAEAIELNGEHKKLECFVCNPETGNHGDTAVYQLDIATGVNEISFFGNDNAPIFNLNGVRVFDAKAPGIYVKNGKKFIVK